jgi:ankyrin repeat protein
MNLIDAVIDNDLPKVKELIASGADVNFQNGYKMTALITASRRGYLEIVKELITAGANPNLQNKCGETALMLASKEGYINIMRELLAGGADVNLKDDYGITALIRSRHISYQCFERRDLLTQYGVKE